MANGTTASARLIVQLEGEAVNTLALEVGLVRIGRLPDNGLVLAHPAVARYHAELRLDEAGALLTDLASGSGTFVGGERLLANRPMRLNDGATFQIGPFLVRYESGYAAEAEEPLEGQGLVAAVVAATVATLPVPARPPRPSYPVPLPPMGQPSAYMPFLPIIFHDGDFLSRYLQMFEAIWEPLEQRQDAIAMYFDPRTCPRRMLAWLASWLGLQVDEHWPEERLRTLLAEAMDLYRWRGTRHGLARMIEVCTGCATEVTDVPEQPFVIRVRVALPPERAAERDMVEELVQLHKPAHVGYMLETQL
ncbi:MAG: phage tail protein [Chloroflexaceae bacterium]|jgi:phage tail-like protein|nr:phage tail protein [Chloroflexaceae bacterium]